MFNINFLQISDSHHLLSYENTNDHFRDALLHLHKFSSKMKKLSEIITEPLDFICHCGDITHGGREEDYISVKNTLKTYFPQVPLIMCVGNHDNPVLVEKVFHSGISSDHAQNFGDLQVITLNNTGGYRGKIHENQCQWLLDCLHASPKDSILLCHHHLKTGQNVMPSAKLDPLFQEVLAHEKLKGIFTGHTHYFYEGKLENVPYYTVDSLCFQGKDSGEGYLKLIESCGYNLFSFQDGVVNLEKKGQLGFSGYLGKVTL